MANILGIQRTPKISNVAGGAIHDIINEIKGGKFTLKATEVSLVLNFHCRLMISMITFK